MRVAILSFAHMHAWSYAAAVKRNPEAELACIWDEDPDRGREAARRFGCPYVEDLEAALAPETGAVIVTAANAHHKDLALRAARAGKHILCEKPLATTLADGEAMIAAGKGAGVQLMTAFPCRYAPPVIRARAALQAGAIGEVLAIRATNRGRMPGGWFVQKELSGGGAVMDHTVHVVDLIRWLLGREVTSVYAEMATRFHDLEVEDCAILTMELEGGIFATLDPSWSRPPVYPTWGDVTMEFVGTRGTLWVDAFGQNLTLYNNRAQAAQWIGFGADVDEAMVADFIRCARENRTPPITGEDGLRAMEVALLAYESAARGEPVSR
nr:MAG: gfo/Idh/MocA family oxidoreductase [Bacillota bacterium]